ncbi:unnamed protein product [Darwinula stevensoni]|uniref:Uncharacterized protein n=1 Tax=Darwinula stevensoni TaxID=69355 RepID=A0A7R9A1N4_9CRUS|nr:unnamed protein product [Darwinula stevensoni]CAG0888076.1 unnamed protein product [Darwinula stevensoni]
MRCVFLMPVTCNAGEVSGKSLALLAQRVEIFRTIPNELEENCCQEELQLPRSQIKKKPRRKPRRAPSCPLSKRNWQKPEKCIQLVEKARQRRQAVQQRLENREADLETWRGKCARSHSFSNPPGMSRHYKHSTCWFSDPNEVFIKGGSVRYDFRQHHPRENDHIKGCLGWRKSPGICRDPQNELLA